MVEHVETGNADNQDGDSGLRCETRLDEFENVQPVLHRVHVTASRQDHGGYQSDTADPMNDGKHMQSDSKHEQHQSPARVCDITGRTFA